MGNVGSYLTIRNDTRDVWQVKIGPDEAAIKVVTIVVSVLGAITGVAGAVGAFAGVTALAAANGVLIMGISATNLAAFTAAAASVAAASGIVTVGTGFSSAVVAMIQSQLVKEGYLTLAPGQSYRYGKMSLSLWQQGTCRRTRANPNNPDEILVETLYMRPIFSGSTDNSNINHDISFWINKWGVEQPPQSVRRG